MRGFILPPVVLVILFLFMGVSLKTKLPNDQSLIAPDENVTIQPQDSPSATPSAAPILSPTVVANKPKPSTIFCIITPGAERVPPNHALLFTAELKDKTGQIKSVDWDMNGDNKIDFYKQSSSFSHIYKDPGNYTVKAKVTLTNGQQSQWCLNDIQVNYHDVSCTLSTTDLYAQNLTSGKVPLKVCINSGTSSDSVLDKDGVEGYLWDYDGDGNWDSSLVSYGSTCYTYNNPKTYTIRMQVKMKSGRSNICSTTVNATN